MRHVIVGNGVAAITALQAIRSLRPKDEITVISGEDCPAYSPALATYYLGGKISYRRMFLCNREFYHRNRVRLMWGQKAAGLDAADRVVRLEDGQTVPYDRALIATGSRPAVPPVPGAPLGLPLWTAEQARQLKDASTRARRVVIVGAGLIGLQVLDALSPAGARGQAHGRRRISLVEMQSHVLPRVLDEAGARLVETKLQQVGVDLHLGEEVREVREVGALKEIQLAPAGARGQACGTALEAEVVVWAVGVRPNRDFLAGSGLAMEQGVVVDDEGRTNLEGVYAAGDVAQARDPVSGQSLVMATWPNAVAQGQVAGRNMAGDEARGWRCGRVNILAPLGLPVASLGLVRAEAPGDDETAQRRNGSYRKLVFRDGRLAGAVLVGEVGEAGVLANLMERNIGGLPLREGGAHYCMARALGPR